MYACIQYTYTYNIEYTLVGLQVFRLCVGMFFSKKTAKKKSKLSDSLSQTCFLYLSCIAIEVKKYLDKNTLDVKELKKKRKNTGRDVESRNRHDTDFFL